MPSAANVKIDKAIPSENALADSSANNTPLRQAITVVEHKIRNLEKRKAKLESYKELQASGKDLNQDQKTAVAKYEEVVMTLEFARDICKQFLSIATSSEKEAKKLARKEAAAKSQAELAKLREVLLVQDALTQRGQESNREDFLAGRNGAPLLTPNDLKCLDELCGSVTPKHEAGDPTAFSNQVQAAAEHLLAVVDGKPKEAFGSSYSQIKEVIGKIHLSGYLDQAQDAMLFEETVEVELLPQEPMMVPEQIMNHEVLPPQPQEVMPPIETLTIEPSRPPIVPVVEQLPIEQQPPPQLPPPEQMYFQPPPQPLQPQPPRPISEVLGGSKFFFLQESELDTPPEQIPSQTFTNQSYVAGPPPPIPLPPHFQPYPGSPPNQAPPGNGIGVVMEEHNLNLNQNDESLKQRQQERPPRPNNQTFYPNNNGYNRPRQNRNGPRPSNRPNNQ